MVTIRPVLLSDAEALHQNCFSRNTREEVAAALQSHLDAMAAGDALRLVAIVDGAAIGNALLLRRSHPLQRHRAVLADLVVTVAWQGKGVARQLVDALAEQAGALGISLLETSCRGGEAAEAIYPRLAFVACGRLPGGLVEPWGERRIFDEVFFFRPIAPIGDSEIANGTIGP